MPKSTEGLLSLAKTSMLGGTAGTSIQEILQQSTPGFGFLQSFFATWLKLDLTTLAAALTIFGTMTGAVSGLQSFALKVYWWFTKVFTASISIASNDRLNREILNWLGAKVLTRQGTRILTARCEILQNDAWHPRRATTERNDLNHEKRLPIQYLPTFGTTWFIHDHNIFVVRRIPSNPRMLAGPVPDEYAAAPEGDEPLVVMCIGRSVKPIKRFLDHCRDFAEKQRETFITVRSSKGNYSSDSWDTTILRAIRPLETIHFDELVKAELIADIENYLDSDTRRFYIARGIPYRRGYLLHGSPGTGKTSLSLGLASCFGLELYLLHLPSVREDKELARLFTSLPPRCIVLLEDIDAVGIKRQPDMIDEDEDDEDRLPSSRVSLSGLLNVLDGVASQEGRIVLMTSNFAHRLDKALVRPGRIDKMIYLGNISARSAKLMFLRMYAPDEKNINPASPQTMQIADGELEKLALEFCSKIPEAVFTPAQLQGYLLNLRNSPTKAAAGIVDWVTEEQIKMEEVKLRAQEIAAWRAKKKKDRAMNVLATSLAGFEEGIDNVLVIQAEDRESCKLNSAEKLDENASLIKEKHPGKNKQEGAPEEKQIGTTKDDNRLETKAKEIGEAVIETV